MLYNETTVIFGTIKKETDKAILLDDGDHMSWIPKSQIEFNEDVDHLKIIAVTMPEWLAIDKGFE